MRFPQHSPLHIFPAGRSRRTGIDFHANPGHIDWRLVGHSCIVKLIPANYFFQGISAEVQLFQYLCFRNLDFHLETPPTFPRRKSSSKSSQLLEGYPPRADDRPTASTERRPDVGEGPGQTAELWPRPPIDTQLIGFRSARVLMRYLAMNCSPNRANGREPQPP